MPTALDFLDEAPPKAIEFLDANPAPAEAFLDAPLEAPAKPKEFDPSTVHYGDLSSLGHDLTAEQLATAKEKLTTPLVHLPRMTAPTKDEAPQLPFSSQDFGPMPPVPSAVVSGVYNAAAPFVEGLTSPANLALAASTAGVGALAQAGSIPAKAALTAAGVGFGGVAAKDAVELAGHAREVLANPEATLQEKTAAVAAPVFAGGLSFAALAGSARLAAGEVIPRINAAYPEVFWKKSGLSSEQFAAEYPAAVRRVAGIGGEQPTPADVAMVQRINAAAKAAGVKVGDLARGRILAENIEWQPRGVQSLLPDSLKPEAPAGGVGFRPAVGAPEASPPAPSRSPAPTAIEFLDAPAAEAGAVGSLTPASGVAPASPLTIANVPPFSLAQVTPPARTNVPAVNVPAGGESLAPALRVSPTAGEILSRIENVMQAARGAARSRAQAFVDLMPVDERLRQDAARALGYPLGKGYVHVMDEDLVRKNDRLAKNPKAQRDLGFSLPADDEYGMIPDILRNYDSLSATTIDGKPAVELRKRYQDHYYILQEVRVGRNKFAVRRFVKEAAPPVLGATPIDYDVGGGGLRTSETRREQPADSQPASVAPVKTEIAGTPATVEAAPSGGAVVSPTPAADRQVAQLTDKKQFKVQKEYLVESARKLAAEAPEAPIGDMVTIEVPGDGTFRVPHHQAALSNFADIVEKRMGKSFALGGVDQRVSSPFSSELRGNVAPAPSGIAPVKKSPTAADLTKAAQMAAPEHEEFLGKDKEGKPVKNDRAVMNDVLAEDGFGVSTDGRRLFIVAGAKGKTANEISASRGSRYPNWRQVVPKYIKISAGKITVGKDAPAGRFQVDTAAALKILHQVRSVLTEKSHAVALFDLGSGKLGFAAQSPDVGDYRSDGVLDGMVSITSADPSYIIDALTAARHAGHGEVKLYVHDNLGPIVIVGGNSFAAVTMPVRSSESGRAVKAGEIHGAKPKPAAKPAKKTKGTSSVGDPLGMPAIPPGVPSGSHGAGGRMPVAMEPILPGQVDVPTVMAALENVVRALGGESPIRRGRFYANARGVFNTFSKTIRLRQDDNIPTAAHEVAHAFSDRLFGSAMSSPLLTAMRASPIGRQAITELRGLGRALYGSQRPAAGYTAEGFAEFVRLWLTTESAASRAPNAAKWMENEVFPANPALAAALQGARSKIDVWRGQGAEGRAAAQLKDAPGRLQVLRDFVREKLSMQGVVEEFSPLDELAEGFAKTTGRKLPANENPYLLATAYRGSAGSALETMVERGMIDVWGNLTGPGLKEALARITPEESGKFSHYLWARRALERWSKGKNPGMALADAEYLRAKLETPAFIDAASKYYQWWDGVLEYLKQASPATNGPLVDAIRKGSSDYVPLARVLDPKKTKAAVAAAQGGGLHRMHGSGLPVKNLYLQSLLVAENLIARAHRDLVLDAVVNLARHEGMGWLVEEVPITRVMESISIEKIRREMEAYGVDTSAIPDDSLLKYATHLDAPTGSDPIIARTTPTGTKWFQIPAEVHELLAGVEAPARLGWVFELLAGAPGRMFKLGTTGVRASFSLVTNPARDLPTFLLQSVAGNPASRAGAWLAGLFDIVRAGLGGKESPELALYHQLGVEASNFLGGDIRRAQREAKSLFHGRTYRIFHSPVESLREFFSFSEATPRLAELSLLAKELGWKPGQTLTPQQAVLLRVAAKRVTTDFSAASKSGRIINRAVPFYNAGVQGARALVRGLRGDKDTGQRNWRQTFRAVLNGLTLLTLPVLYNWWRNKDEDWYRMLPWRERYLYLNVKGARGVIYQVPLPPEWGSIFATLPTALVDYYHAKDPRGLHEALGHVFNMANPMDLPVLGKIAKEQWSNRVDFFDRPIVPRGELDLRPGDQRSAYSSWLAKSLGDVFPDKVSPRRFDAAVREVFGGVGSDVVGAPEALMRALGLKVEVKQRETEAADFPIFGRIARRGGAVSALNQSLIDFWDDHDRYAARLASNKKALKEGRRVDATMSLKDQMYALRLDDSIPFVRMYLDIADRTPELAKRQEMYRRAALQAQRITASRPKN